MTLRALLGAKAEQLAKEIGTGQVFVVDCLRLGVRRRHDDKDAAHRLVGLRGGAGKAGNERAHRQAD